MAEEKINELYVFDFDGTIHSSLTEYAHNGYNFTDFELLTINRDPYGDVTMFLDFLNLQIADILRKHEYIIITRRPENYGAIITDFFERLSEIYEIHKPREIIYNALNKGIAVSNKANTLEIPVENVYIYEDNINNLRQIQSTNFGTHMYLVIPDIYIHNKTNNCIYPYNTEEFDEEFYNRNIREMLMGPRDMVPYSLTELGESTKEVLKVIQRESTEQYIALSTLFKVVTYNTDEPNIYDSEIPIGLIISQMSNEFNGFKKISMNGTFFYFNTTIAGLFDNVSVNNWFINIRNSKFSLKIKWDINNNMFVNTSSSISHLVHIADDIYQIVTYPGNRHIWNTKQRISNIYFGNVMIHMKSPGNIGDVINGHQFTNVYRANNLLRELNRNEHTKVGFNFDMLHVYNSNGFLGIPLEANPRNTNDYYFTEFINFLKGLETKEIYCFIDDIDTASYLLRAKIEYTFLKVKRLIPSLKIKKYTNFNSIGITHYFSNTVHNINMDHGMCKKYFIFQELHNNFSGDEIPFFEIDCKMTEEMYYKYYRLCVSTVSDERILSSELPVIGDTSLNGYAWWTNGTKYGVYKTMIEKIVRTFETVKENQLDIFNSTQEKLKAKVEEVIGDTNDGTYDRKIYLKTIFNRNVEVIKSFYSSQNLPIFQTLYELAENIFTDTIYFNTTLLQHIKLTKYLVKAGEINSSEKIISTGTIREQLLINVNILNTLGFLTSLGSNNISLLFTERETRLNRLLNWYTETSKVALLQAETGYGKTVLAPLFAFYRNIFGRYDLGAYEIITTQPKILNAELSSGYLSTLFGYSTLGSPLVGVETSRTKIKLLTNAGRQLLYNFTEIDNENQGSLRLNYDPLYFQVVHSLEIPTMIKFMTEEILLNDIINNVDRYQNIYVPSMFIFDEIHELSVNVELLTMLKTLIPMVNKLLLMSATIDVQKYEKYFNKYAESLEYKPLDLTSVNARKYITYPTPLDTFPGYQNLEQEKRENSVITFFQEEDIKYSHDHLEKLFENYKTVIIYDFNVDLAQNIYETFNGKGYNIAINISNSPRKYTKIIKSSKPEAKNIIIRDKLLPSVTEFKRQNLDTKFYHTNVIMSCVFYVQMILEYFISTGSELHNSTILIFIESLRNINILKSMLVKNLLWNREQLQIYIIHSESQDIIPTEPNGKPMIILGTERMESGITFSNVFCVIDAITVNTSVFLPMVGSNLLYSTKISIASSIQRRGRTGRRNMGFYLPLITEEVYNGLDKYPMAKIQKQDSTEIVSKIALFRNKLQERGISFIDPYFVNEPSEALMNYAYNYMFSMNLIKRRFIENSLRPVFNPTKMLRLTEFITPVYELKHRLLLINALKYNCFKEMAIIVAFIQFIGAKESITNKLEGLITRVTARYYDRFISDHMALWMTFNMILHETLDNENVFVGLKTLRQLILDTEGDLREKIKELWPNNYRLKFYADILEDSSTDNSTTLNPSESQIHNITLAMSDTYNKIYTQDTTLIGSYVHENNYYLLGQRCYFMKSVEQNISVPVERIKRPFMITKYKENTRKLTSIEQTFPRFTRNDLRKGLFYPQQVIADNVIIMNRHNSHGFYEKYINIVSSI